MVEDNHFVRAKKLDSPSCFLLRLKRRPPSPGAVAGLLRLHDAAGVEGVLDHPINSKFSCTPDDPLHRAAQAWNSIRLVRIAARDALFGG